MVNFTMSTKRFIAVAIILFVMWAGLMLLFYFKADEVTKNPCQVCAKKMNEDVICSSTIGNEYVIFHPDFSMEDHRHYARANLLQ